MTAIDPVDLSRALIRRPSVTPADEGALDVLEGALSGLGFKCTRLKFEDVDNLFARYGEAAPAFLFRRTYRRRTPWRRGGMEPSALRSRA